MNGFVVILIETFKIYYIGTIIFYTHDKGLSFNSIFSANINLSYTVVAVLKPDYLNLK